MKNISLLILGLFALTACNNQKSNSSENTDSKSPTEATTIGGKKDEHGCLVAAGETWSELKQGCIKVFDVGLRLNPIDSDTGGAIISAFIVFNDDKSKVELFLPSNNNSTFILNKGEKGIYQNDTYRFNAGKSVLTINGKQKYKANTE